MYEYRIRIVRVVDGDTVDCDIDVGFGIWLLHSKDRPQRIRLAYLDTPECRTRDKREKKYGLLAKARVEDLLPVGSLARLKSHKLDKYGRILGTVWPRDDETALQSSVTELLIAERLGVPYMGGNKAAARAAHEANWKLIEEREERHDRHHPDGS